MERDDYSELEHLREQNGQYRLLLTNEVDETQYTNLMELWVVDHAPGSRVVADERGTLHGFTRVQPLSAARDRYDNDLLPWLQTTDRKIWEPETVAGPDGNLRQEVLLTFPKPDGATQANLIANTATGWWGSYMIKKMVELYGRDTASWLASLDENPAAVQGLHAWGEREGTYRLPIEVEEPDGWQTRGTLPNGGPYLAEDRTIALDISHVTGKQLRIRLRPDMSRQNADRVADQLFYDRSVISEEMIERSYAIARDRRCAINMLRYVLATRKYDVRKCLPQIQCDVLMIWGEHDRVAPVEDWEQSLSLFANASLHKLARCGPSPMIENPAEFNAILTKFMLERPSGSESVPKPLAIDR